MRGDRELYTSVSKMLGAQASRILIQGAYFAVLARALGPDDFGRFSALVALAAILVPFSSLGLDMLMVRNVARDPSSDRLEWTRTVVAVLVGGAVGTGLLSVFGWLVFPPGITVLAACMIVAADLIAAKAVEAAGLFWQAKGNSRPLLILPSLQNLTRAVGVGLLVIMPHRGVGAWAAVYLFASVPVAVWAIVTTSMRVGRPEHSPELTAADIGRGLSLGSGAAARTAFKDIDKTLLARIGDPTDAGTYAAAYRIVDMAYAPIRAIAATTYPRFFKAGGSGVREAIELVKKVAPLTIGYSAVAGVGLAVAAPLVVTVLGEEFASSTRILPFLAILLVPRALASLVGDALTGSDRFLARAVIVGVLAAAKIGVNLMVIPQFGLAGVIVTSVVFEAILLVALVVLLARTRRAAMNEERARGLSVAHAGSASEPTSPAIGAVDVMVSAIAPVTGIEKATLNMVRHLRAKGLDVKLICLAGGQADLEVEPDAHIAGPSRTGWARVLGVRSALTAHRMRRPGVPLVLSGVLAAIPYLTVNRWRRRSVVIWEHSLVAENHATTFRRRLRNRVARWVYGASSVIVCVSEPLRNDVLNWAGEVPVLEIPNYLSGATFASNGVVPRAWHAGQPVRIFMAGRLVPAKNYVVAFEAVALCRDHISAVRIAGAGPQRRELEELAERLGISNLVTFLGHISATDVVDEYQRCDLVLHPSTGETFGYIYFEAASHGRPVVAVRHRQSDSVIPRFVPGITTAGTPAGIAGAITEFVRCGMSDDAFARARDCRAAAYSDEAITARWLSVLKEAVE